MYMRGVALLVAKNRFKQIYQLKGSGSWGLKATTTHRKLANNERGEGEVITKENTDPIVTFSRPPPLPPILGPLVALSLLETWCNGDADDES